MLRLRPLRVLHPSDLEGALRCLADHPGARLLAGGTDLLPALKLQQIDVPVLVSLRDVAGLTGVTRDADVLCIGARTLLRDVAGDPLLREHAPALAAAAGLVAGPQLRNMGTLAGNLCQDTRCRYINQSPLWREALGGCLKSHGDACHVVPGGRRCVAALSSDTAPVLVVLDATLDLIGPSGRRVLPVLDLYGKDGTSHLALAPGEVITAIGVPLPAGGPGPGPLVAYRKWAPRKSIDFPLVSVAVRLDPGADGAVIDGSMACGVLGPRPSRVSLSGFAGRCIDSDLARDLGALAERRFRPLPNVPYDPDYRRVRLGVEVERAVLSLRGTSS